MPRAPFGAVLLAIVVSTAATLRAEPAAEFLPTFGPTIGNNRFATRIESVDGVADVDDYVGAMLPGETLTATVVAARRSHVRPRLSLIGPDGAAVPVVIKVPRNGKSASFKRFVIPTTGRFTVRVAGADGTEGAYVIAFSVKAARPQHVRGGQLGEDAPLFKVERFHGVDGGLLDFKLTWRRISNAVDLTHLTDARGDDALAADGKKLIEKAVTDVRRRTVSLTKAPLHFGDGDYAVRVRTLQGTATYDAVFAVTPPGRTSARRPTHLSTVEPFLDAVAAPLRGRPGFPLDVHGRNFSVANPPRVHFGGREGVVTGVASDGTSLTVIVPQGVPGTTVPVAVANADGQAAVRANYFFYLQPIQITDLVDDAGAPVRTGSTDGGRLLHLLGTHFEAGQTVSMGGAAARVVDVPSAGEMRIVTPAAAPGDSFVVVTDVFGGVTTSAFTFRFKTPPTFDAFPYHPSVAAVNTAVEVTITGSNFLENDELSFAGAPIASTFVDDETRTFSAPALAAGSYAVTLTDEIGTVKRGPDFVVKPAPTITAVTIVSGPHIGATKIPVSGGATIRVDGEHFHDTDAVTLGGAAVEFLSHAPESFTFAAPPGSPGGATLAVVDGAGQGTTLPDALRYVGYSDATASRSPGASTADSLAAEHGAVGDLDGDGDVDDVVLTSSYYSYIGTRTERTRLLLGDASGALVDVTSTNFPAFGTDSSGVDDWNADAVAVGDVDGGGALDIVIAGLPPYSYNGGIYKSVRMFTNDGSGAFTQDEANAPPSTYVAGVRAMDQTGAYFVVYGTVFESGYPTSVAIGDLDHDGAAEIVVGRDRYDLRYVGIDPTQVDFTQSPPYVQSANVTYLSVYQYNSATKVFKNDVANGNGFVERTAAWMPSAGDSTVAPSPCFQSMDLALGDVDKDGNVDIVETWPDPTTVSAFGTYMGPNVDSPRTATRVLLNDGTGQFTDATTTWMPSAASPEFWQANRLALVDLNKDGKLDLVLLHFAGTDAFNTSPPTFGSSALRVLRNDTTTFLDVTSTAVPSLPGNGDNFRGDALAARDVDGDTWVDILVGTTEQLTDAGGNPLPSTRLFRGGPGLVFTPDTAFLPTPQTDTGEASGFVLVGDLAGRPDPSLLLISNVAPLQSPGGEQLRVLDWNR